MYFNGLYGMISFGSAFGRSGVDLSSDPDDWLSDLLAREKTVSGGRLCQDAQKKRNDALGSDGGDFHDCSVPAFVCGVPHPSGFRLDA